jgi:anti-anti-sigma factor
MARRTWDFSLLKERVDGALVVSLRGRLSSESAHLLDDGLTTPEDVAVVVDLKALDYISGPGLAKLGAAAGQAAAEHRVFLMCGLSESVLTCFELAGLLSKLLVCPNRTEALARISTAQDSSA